MLLEGPQQTTGSIGQTWKTGNGRSRLVLTGQHKHTPPPPPHTKDRGGRTREGTPHPPHTGGPRTEHEPASTMQTTTNPPPPPNKRRRGPEDHNHPQHHRATRAPHTPPHVSVVIAGRQRPDPSRTRKLRPPAPMVLRPPGRGRAGHHRAHTTPPPPTKTAANGGGKQTTTQQRRIKRPVTDYR